MRIAWNGKPVRMIILGCSPVIGVLRNPDPVHARRHPAHRRPRPAGGPHGHHSPAGVTIGDAAAGVIAICIVLFALALLAPRLSRGPERATERAFGAGGRGAAKAPGRSASGSPERCARARVPPARARRADAALVHRERPLLHRLSRGTSIRPSERTGPQGRRNRSKFTRFSRHGSGVTHSPPDHSSPTRQR